MKEAQTVQVTGEEILNSIPGDELLNLAIMKLLMEGKDWREFAHDFPKRCWDMSNALNEEGYAP